MAYIKDYWKIITPNSRKKSYTAPTINVEDSANPNMSGYASMSTVSWFSNMLKGSSGRIQRYKQYDAMDNGDVNRALDIIAEEMSNADKRTDLPFIIDYQIEENQDLPDTTVTTVRAALRHWSKLHNLDKRIFNVSRTLVKYGDCFFRKTSDTKKWEYIDPTRVVGIELDRDGDKINYHIRPSNFQQSHAQQTASNSSQAYGSIELEVCPASSIIHFTLSDDMGDSAPFGMSCLQAAFKDFQKLTMLEDSAIIYRIVRAPERRVFYIDVGNMPPVKVKTYLEQVKNDIRQKRIPSSQNKNDTDSAYNPESIGEDYFFAVAGGSTGTRGSRVETLPGGVTWDIPELDYFQNKVFRALRVPTSYMKGQDATNPGAAYSDGKSGVAYMEERIFANYVVRLQSCVDSVFDTQFKTYLQVTGINIDPDLFKLTLAEPQNFEVYRRSAMDAELITAYKSLDGDDSLSVRFKQERFLGLTTDEIQMNEAMKRQEWGLEEALNVDMIRQLYDPLMIKARKATKLETQEDDDGEEEAPELDIPDEPTE